VPQSSTLASTIWSSFLLDWADIPRSGSGDPPPGSTVMASEALTFGRYRIRLSLGPNLWVIERFTDRHTWGGAKALLRVSLVSRMDGVV